MACNSDIVHNSVHNGGGGLIIMVCNNLFLPGFTAKVFQQNVL